MSIIDALCDLCGGYADRNEDSQVKASSITERAWCGECNLDNRLPILMWVFDKNAEEPHIKKTEKAVINHPPISRPTWDDYYLGIAKAVSTRGDCVRRQHGAVVVKDHKIISTGYNGTPPGDSRSCGKTGQCPRNLDPSSKHGEGSYDLCWATHAEANALLRADWSDLQGSTIYITGAPCPGCSKLISSVGIEKVIFNTHYMNN